jgi:ubiquinol-cytochrome c reductase iron-sulfur subunit
MGKGRRMLGGAAAYVALRLLRRRARDTPPDEPESGQERIVPPGEPDDRGERAVLALVALTIVAAVAFPVIYALDRLPNQTQLLGAALGVALLSAGAAFIVAGKRLVVEEEAEEDYPEPRSEPDEAAIAQMVDEAGGKISRKRLLGAGAAAAGGALGVAFLAPAVSFGPVFDMDTFLRTPWKRGRRLVDEHERPLRAADIETTTFYTAFPEGVDREQIAAPLVLVRLPPAQLELPPHLQGYDAQGILAFSKICTHAGCAVSLYRAPLFAPASPQPALVCPCHYSTFDVAKGAEVIFGPAGRPLPMLPLMIDRQGNLRAAGNFDGPVGPSWWGVRMKGPK